MEARNERKDKVEIQEKPREKLLRGSTMQRDKGWNRVDKAERQEEED